MAEAVDSIIADLQVRYQQYVDGFDKATAAHDRFTKSVPKIGAGLSPLTQDDAQRYADRHVKASNDIGKAEQQTTVVVKKARKERSDSARAAEKADVDAVTAATRAKVKAEQDAQREIAKAQRDGARETAAQQKRYYAQGPRIFEAKAREFGAADQEREAKAARDAAAAVRAAEKEVAAAAAERAAAEKVAAKAAADAVKAAEKDKQTALAATVAAEKAATEAAERETATRVRLAEVSQRAADRQQAGIKRASGPVTSTGALVQAGERSAIPAHTAAIVRGEAAGEAAGKAVAEKEVNHLLADQADLQARLSVASGKQRSDLRDQIAELRLINQYKRAGLTDEEASIRAERQLAIIEAERDAIARRTALNKAGQFASGAGLGRFGGLNAGTAGILAGATIGITAAVIDNAVRYGNELSNVSKQLGVTTTALQTYQAIARQTGVSDEQLRTGLGQLASNLGRAQEGAKEQGKVFQALGIDIKGVASAGDLLPTLIDRISSIKDPAQRASIETRLFGEEGRKLDGLLSGGNKRVNELADALQKTGHALTPAQIAQLAQTATEFARLKAELQVDFAKTVAGNAEAIGNLARAFVFLAEKALGAVNALSRFRDSNVIHDPNSAPGERERATRRLLASPEGRDTLLDQNDADYATLRNSRRQPARVVVNGQDVTNAPDIAGVRDAADRRAYRQILVSRRRILDAAKGVGTEQQPAVQTGIVSPGLLAKLGAPGGPSAESLAKQAVARQKRYEDELASLQADYLGSLRELVVGSDAQARIDQQQLETARDRRAADIKAEAAAKQIDAARVPELLAANEKAYQERRAVLALQRQVEAYDTLTALAQQSYDVERDHLAAQQALATTTAERGRLARAQIDLDQQRERDAAIRTIFSPDPGVTDRQRQEAGATLRTNQSRADDKRGVSDRENEGPLAQYRRGLDSNSDTIESKEVALLQRFNQGLDDAITKSLHLHGIFGDIVGDLIDMIVKQALIKPLANALFPEGGGGVGGSISGFFSGLFSHRATGGPIVPGASYLVGERGPEIVRPFGAANVYPSGSLPAARGVQSGIVVVQPIHADFSGARTDEQTMREFQRYADAKSEQAYKAAVQTSIKGAPSFLRKQGQITD